MPFVACRDVLVLSPGLLGGRVRILRRVHRLLVVLYNIAQRTPGMEPGCLMMTTRCGDPRSDGPTTVLIGDVTTTPKLCSDKPKR